MPTDGDTAAISRRQWLFGSTAHLTDEQIRKRRIVRLATSLLVIIPPAVWLYTDPAAMYAVMQLDPMPWPLWKQAVFGLLTILSLVIGWEPNSGRCSATSRYTSTSRRWTMTGADEAAGARHHREKCPFCGLRFSQEWQWKHHVRRCRQPGLVERAKYRLKRWLGYDV